MIYFGEQSRTPLAQEHIDAADFEPQLSRRDRALAEGYDPSPDDNCQPAMTPAEYDALPVDHPMKVRTARWAHQGSPTGCADCGTRCERCDDRMCRRWGPEPQAGCETVCVDCPQCPCLACHDARWDALIDREAQFSRDAVVDL